MKNIQLNYLYRLEDSIFPLFPSRFVQELQILPSSTTTRGSKEYTSIRIGYLDKHIG